MEQNRRPGLTNRLLLRWVRAAAVAFENSLPEFKGKGVFTGNPVRPEFHQIPPSERGARLRVLVFGGSQGSNFLNRMVTEALPGLRSAGSRLSLRHQTGREDLEWVRLRYRETGFDEAVVEPFFFDMAERIRDADLIVSRAGATTIAELAAAGRAALLVPFAGAADDHQTLNARELEAAGGAEVLAEAEFTPEVFRNRILAFLEDPDRIGRMEKNLRNLARPDAAEAIAELCLKLMRNKEGEIHV
jgi:UDP-N-acetylglucosamine--N-acetylmuramyl-(pentapeptide) pyrophosphoryl-undecaprenol N-acetylglucosamine transferase